MKHLIKIKIITLLLLVATFTVTRVHAEDSNIFNTSNYSEENIAMTFRDSNIIFSSFPNREEFNYVIISLYGEDGAIYNDGDYSTQNDIIYSTSGISDGIYYIQIYKSPIRYGTSYWSYMYQKGGIKVEIKDGKVKPIESMTYNNNTTIYNGYNADKATIQYYLQPSYGVESDNTEIIKLAKSIVLESDSDYEKIKKVHDWVANNVWYNYDGFYSGEYGESNAVEVYHSKKSVCQGYANLTAALLRALNIPTKVVSGYALGISSEGEWSKKLVNSQETNHAWNEVYVNNRWIIIDTTWDSNNEFLNGQFSKGTGVSGYRYFDPTIEFFSYDHKMFDSSNEVIDYEKNLGYFSLRTKDTTLYYKGTKGESKQIDIEVDYENLELPDWDITYTSSNNAIATVSKKGLITAKNVGDATITAIVRAGNITKEFKIKVTVKMPYIQVIQSMGTIKVGTSQVFKVKLYGLTSVRWDSSNKKVATVDKSGKVTAKSKGTTIITITSGKYKKSVKVKVVK